MSSAEATAQPQQPMVSYALAFAQAGWAVFPCLPNKAPAVAGGFKAASTDPNTIRAMWGGKNHAVGLPCGEAAGITVIDLDVDKTTGEKTGEDSLKALAPVLFAENGRPTVPAVLTPSGGWHLYFRFTPELKSRSAYLPGIDCRTNGGYVIAPQSVIAAGAYRPNKALAQHIDALRKGQVTALPEMPQKLLDALLAGSSKKATTQPALSLSGTAPTAAPAHERSADDLPTEAEIEAILSHVDPNGYDEWTKVLSALKDHHGGIEIARRWSEKSAKHSEREFDRKMQQVKPIALRTIFTLAKANGADLSQIARDHMPKDDEAEIARKCAVVAAQFDAMNVVQLRPDTGASAAAEPITKLPFKPWSPIDAETIPRVHFVYGAFYAKAYTSVTAAAPKVGKSLLAAAEAVDMARGRGFLTSSVLGPLLSLLMC